MGWILCRLGAKECCKALQSRCLIHTLFKRAQGLLVSCYEMLSHSVWKLFTEAFPLTCRIHDTDLKYYANGEDAYEMRKYFKEKKGKSKGKEGDKAAAAAPVAAAAAEAS